MSETTTPSLRPRRAVLIAIAPWVAFSLVHIVGVLVGSLWATAQAWGDVSLYRWWVSEGAQAQGLPVFGGSWVYPFGALLPMLIPMAAQSLGFAGYLLLWILQVTALNAWVVATLLARGARRAVYWWLAFLLAMIPIGFARLDAIICPLMMMALLWLADRPWAAGLLLTIGAWIKVVPGALFLLSLVVVRRRAWQLVVAGASVTLVVVGIAAAGGGLSHLASFMDQQDLRGLQIESVAATWFMFARAWDPSVGVRYDHKLFTYQVETPAAYTIARMLDGALIVLVLIIGALVWLASRRRPDAALLWGSLAVLSGLIVTNKVGSPQFSSWLAVPFVAILAAGIVKRRAWNLLLGAFLIAIAFATVMVYPWGYASLLLHPTGWASWTLLAKNVGVIVVMLASLVALGITAWKPAAPISVIAAKDSGDLAKQRTLEPVGSRVS